MTDVGMGELPNWKHGINFSIDPSDVIGSDNPFANFITDLRNSMNRVKASVVTNSEARKAAMDAALVMYNKFNSTKQDLRDSIVGNVETFAQDIAQSGVKFYIAFPFLGGVNNARAITIESLSGRVDNFPNYSSNTYVSSISLLFNVGETLESVLGLFLKLMPIFGIKNDTYSNSLNDLYNNPFLSPILNVLDIKDYQPEINELDGEYSVDQPGNDALGSALGYLTEEQTRAGLGILNTAAMLYNFPSTLQSQMSDYLASSIVGDIIEDIKNPTNLQSPISELLNGIKNAKDITPQKVIKNFVNPLDNLTTNFNNQSKELQKNPYNNWFNLLTLGDLIPGITDLSKKVTGITAEVSDVLQFGADGIMNGATLINSGLDYVAEKAVDTSNATDDFLNKLKNQLKFLNADMFAVPPTLGGTEILRLMYSEWMKENQFDAPAYANNSMTLMLTVVLGAPDKSINALTQVGKLFNINLE